MFFQNVLRSPWRCGIHVRSQNATLHRRAIHYDGRNRLTSFWTPTQNKKTLSVSSSTSTSNDAEDGHELLLRAGFLRQAHSGIFHLLPLGLRVQNKLERLIDKHMQILGASKVSLSSISSQDLWRKSGRLEGRDSELFQLEDRKGAAYLLSPTHEEEITNVVKNAIHSYRDLPLRLYQVSRKYRDEARPRQGLLRGREFIMKDLYTFDVTVEQAMKTYEEARAAYRAFLDELNLPYLVATADSGSMGGDHSHEYHFKSSRGEDTIINCSNCGMCINEELYVGNHSSKEKSESARSRLEESGRQDLDKPGIEFQVWYGRVANPAAKSNERDEPTPKGPTNGPDTATLLQIFYPAGPFELNTHAVKRLVPDVNTGETIDPKDSGLTGKNSSWDNVVSIRDPRVPLHAILNAADFDSYPSKAIASPPDSSDIKEAPFLLTKARKDDPCPNCSNRGSMYFEQAVEIGHTFHLGTRYSAPLEAMVHNEQNELVEMQMGCHGIGVSRLLGAVATLLADNRGLNWPMSIAPFGIVLVGTASTSHDNVTAIYDQISRDLGVAMDVVIDDRERPMGWKLNDADLLGYPFIVVLGKAWSQRGAVELQCRRLGIKEEVPRDQLIQKLRERSAKL